MEVTANYHQRVVATGQALVSLGMEGFVGRDNPFAMRLKMGAFAEAINVPAALLTVLREIQVQKAQNKTPKNPLEIIKMCAGWI